MNGCSIHTGRVRGTSAAFALLCGLVVSLVSVQAQPTPDQFDYARPGLEWYSLETEHFRVHFHNDKEGNGSSRTAQVVARIAEDIYGPITELYGLEPETKVDFILKDYEDYSNGAAYFFDNKIEIWAPALESPLRGIHDWLRNVITHEFTHIVQVQKTMKTGRRVPFLYLQYLGYEEVRRPDVLYGYPNVIASYPYATLSNPAWLAEGTAQYMRTGLEYDRWDSHRDMLLRTQILGGTAMSLERMGTFMSKNSLERESVYNHGYAFTRFLAGRFGEDVLRRISEALSDRATWNVDKAIRKATGFSGEQLHTDWMDSLRQHYEDFEQKILPNEAGGRVIEPGGFANYYPRYSPDGRKVAYLSNGNADFSLLSLVVKDLASGENQAFHLDSATAGSFAHTCSLGETLVPGVSGAFDWHPDGHSIVFSRILETQAGYRFSDLFTIDLESGKKARLTEGFRAAAPAFSDTASEIVFLRQDDGTTNLFVRNNESESVRQITQFSSGEQVTDPDWKGDWVYFSLNRGTTRGLYRVRPDGSGMEEVVNSEADERSPFVDSATGYVYYSSDETGIFNIYRKSLEGGEAEQLTNVTGGAFMPSVDASGRLVFSRYEASGYKIAAIDAPENLTQTSRIQYDSPVSLEKGHAETGGLWENLARYSDAGVQKWIPGKNENSALPDSTIRPYRANYTDFSFLPVIRLDNYSRSPSRSIQAQAAQRSEVSALGRNAKVGLYVSSREILEGLSFFGGFLVAPASSQFDDVRDFLTPSRFRRLERDVQLIVDYKKGLRFLPKRWSPQISVEVFHVQRSVENGLSLEEFPCTACYPETSYADLTYALWEAGLVARSKVNRTLLLEAGYRYSPYQVRTESFFSRELKRTIESSSQEYYRGRTMFAAAHFAVPVPTRNADVLPEGLRAHLTYEYSPSRLLDRFDIEDGILIPQYTPYRNHRISLDTRFGKSLGKFGRAPHGFSARLKGSTLLGGEKDDFFNDYVGGLAGARGYPFYALGGNETAHAQISYIFPLLTGIDRQIGFITADKLYARVFADAAVAWSGPWPGIDAVRKDVGAELRLSLGSFYLLPTALFISGTYGFDRFSFELDEGFQTPEGQSFVEYGEEFRLHFGLLFDFNL